VNWANSNQHLSVVALENGLAKYVGEVDLEPSETYTGASERNLGTIMEALLGAIHEDCGQDSRVVRSAISRMG
jgi:dsRNA-specific ribonuclease